MAHKALLLGIATVCCWFGLHCVAVDAQDTIPVGTKITVQNWQQYRQFMDDGLQAFFSGRYFWKMPAQAVIEVGPFVDYPLPHIFWTDTEKYSGQAKLRQLPSGGYTLDGYVSGVPFPHPGGPLAAYQLLYDLYYNYRPAYQYEISSNLLTDRFLNSSLAHDDVTFYKLSHASDVGYPTHNPDFPNVFQTLYAEIIDPEQSKYTADLQVTPDDAQRLPEAYVFVPSLRRTLRLSSSARCSPLQGSDWTEEDTENTPLPPGMFEARLVGSKKVLNLWPAPTVDHKLLTTYDSYYPPLHFPKPELGKWNLRDVWVVELRRVPSQRQGYCYSKRVLYIDKEIFGSLHRALYDADGNLWKAETNALAPAAVPGGGWLTGAIGLSTFYDLQNSHQSAVIVHDVWINENIPKKYQDYLRHATPAGLSQIMQ